MKGALAIADILSELRDTIQRMFSRPVEVQKPDSPNATKKPQNIPVAAQPSSYGISGKCEICGREFDANSAKPRDCLLKVSYMFYGKQRERKICKKCLGLLREDKNFIQK